MKVNTIKELFKRLKKYILFILLSLLLSIVIVLLTLWIPILVGNAIDNMIGVNNVNYAEISTIFQKLTFCIIVIPISQWIMNLVNNYLVYSLVRDIRNEAITKIEKLPLKYIDGHSYGQVISNVISDVDQLADGLLMGFSQFFTGIMTIGGTIVFMLMLRWQIALVVIILTPLSLFVARFIATKTHKLFIEQSKIRAEQTSYIEEMINNQKVVQIFNYEDDSIEHFNQINDKLEKVAFKANFYSSTTNPSTRFINAIVYAIVCLIGAFKVISTGGLFTVGILSSFLSYANQYTKPFNEISSVIAELQNSLACASRVFSLLNEKEEEEESSKEEIINPKGDVEFRNVSFSYVEDKKLIENFSLCVSKGKRVAIVGPTGCGKTTLINLIMRFYDVNKGSIILDGKNTKTISKNSLRESIGMVLQETWLKSGTIRENLLLAKQEATEEEIIEACKESHSYDFIMQLKDGFDTYINEEGGSLSQGQKQLLCITRIMLKKPEILILDEATSNIDTRTELKIQDAFEKLMKGRTSFIVAHRLSTIQTADIIIVMNNGNIIEQGNHEELIEKKGFYFNLFNSQFNDN